MTPMPKLYANGEQLQQEIMDALQAEHMPLSEVHPFVLFLSVANQHIAQLCVDELKTKASFCHVEVHQLDNESIVGFVHCHSSANSEQLGSLANLLVMLQAQHDCEVDGWEIKQSEQDNVDLATEILYSIRKHYATKTELLALNIDEYAPHLKADYVFISKCIKQAGFIYLTDTKDKQSCERHPTVKACYRVFYHPTLRACLTFYQIPEYSSVIMEITSFFADGYAVSTSTSPILAQIAQFPNLSVQHFNINTDISQLLSAHEQSVNAYKTTHNALQLEDCSNLDNINTLNQKLQQSKGEYLESIGWVPDEYVMELAGDDLALGTNIILSIQALLEMERLAA